MQERFNKDLEEIKKNQYIMNNTTNKIKNTLEVTNSRITEAEDRISELEDRMVEINESERNSQQIKEQDKCPPNQTKEEEIGNLPDKEFRDRKSVV